jgi:hypothetical protein
LIETPASENRLNEIFYKNVFLKEAFRIEVRRISQVIRIRKGFGVRTKGKRFNWQTEFSQFYVFLKVVHITKFYQGKRFSIEPSKSLYSFFIVACKNFSIEISLRFFCEDKMRKYDDNRTILVFKGLKLILQLVFCL